MNYEELHKFLLQWRNKNEVALPGSVCEELALALSAVLDKEAK
jgi:hypothetical protein